VARFGVAVEKPKD